MFNKSLVFGIIGIIFLFVYIFIMYALSFMYDTKNNDDEQK